MKPGSKRGLTLVEIMVVTFLAALVAYLGWYLTRDAVDTMGTTSRKDDAVTSCFVAAALIRDLTVNSFWYWSPRVGDDHDDPTKDTGRHHVVIDDRCLVRFDPSTGLLSVGQDVLPIPLTEVRFYRDGPVLSYLVNVDRAPSDTTGRSVRERSTILGSVCVRPMQERQVYDRFVTDGPLTHQDYAVPHPGCYSGIVTLLNTTRVPGR